LINPSNIEIAEQGLNAFEGEGEARCGGKLNCTALLK